MYVTVEQHATFRARSVRSWIMVCLVACLTGCGAAGMPPHPSQYFKMWLLFGLIVLILLLVWVSRNWDRRRREGISAVAARMGFAFEAKGTLVPEWRKLRVFQERSGQKVQNVLRARRSDAEVLFFDYEWYKTGGDPGTGCHSVSQSVAAFRIRGKTLPPFGVYPAVLLNRLPAWARSALGIVTFDSPNPDFARHYVVEASRHDHAAVRQLLSGGVQSVFAALDAGHEWSTEGAGEWLVLYRLDRLAKPEAYVDFVHRATAIAEALNGAGLGKDLPQPKGAINMAFCMKCGAALKEGASFCGSCGARVAEPSAPARPAPPVAASPVQAPQPPAPSSLSAPPGTPSKSGSLIMKIVAVVLGIFALFTVLGIGAFVYLGYRAKKKVDQIQQAYKQNDLNKLAEALTGKSGLTGPSNTALPNWKPAAPGSEALPSSRVPLRAGLTVVTAVNQPGVGDYESIKTVEAITPQSVELHYSADVPANPFGALGSSGSPQATESQRMSCGRTVATSDLRTAHAYRESFCTASIEPGSTAITVSAEVLSEIKSGGRASFSYELSGLQAVIGMFKNLGKLVQNPGQALPAGRNPAIAPGAPLVNCMMTRAEPADVAVPVLVNEQRVDLSAVHAKCSSKDEVANFYLLDDVDNPLALAFQLQGGRLQVIKISFPSPAPSKQIEQRLATTGRAEVYGIYFDFASDQIRAESESVLKEIADAMKANPAWKLSVEGHTDNIGGDAYNLDLSNRRAAAVKEALVERYHIRPERLATTGYGASRPKESNDTLEGRARNRRVELVRQ